MTEKEFREKAKAKGLSPSKIEKAVFDWRKKQGFEPSNQIKILNDTRELMGYRYPDKPNASLLYDNPKAQEAEVRRGKQQAYREAAGPAGRAVAGAGRFAMSLVPGERAAAERQAFDEASEGDLATTAGRMAPEIGLSMGAGGLVSGATRAGLIANPILRSAAQGLAYGLPSTALHQTQGLVAGRGLDPVGAAVETAASVAIPAAGAAAGQYLTRQAPGVLQTAVKPVLNQMDVPNPPNFEAALRNRLVPYFGGLEGSQERARAMVGRLGAERDAAAQAASRVGNQTASRVPFVQGALFDTRRELQAQMRTPRSQMLTQEYQDARNALDFWRQEFAARTTANRGRMSVEDAMAFRQRIDDEVNWRAVNQANTPGFDRASAILRRRLNERIEQEAPVVGARTREMAEVVPYEQALARRNLQAGNNFRVGLLDLAALSAGGAAGGVASLGAAPATALGALALRRLTSTPGGAAMMYDAGQNLLRRSLLRDLAMQGGRSGVNDILKDY